MTTLSLSNPYSTTYTKPPFSFWARDKDGPVLHPIPFRPSVHKPTSLDSTLGSASVCTYEFIPPIRFNGCSKFIYNFLPVCRKYLQNLGYICILPSAQIALHIKSSCSQGQYDKTQQQERTIRCCVVGNDWRQTHHSAGTEGGIV